ncbi:hypothetical protein ABIF91_009620 [Bradyrhizobium sp. USDA 241]
MDIDIAQRLGQQGAGPARKPLRWRLIQQLQNPLVGRLRIDRLLARPRLVLQPFKAMVGIAMELCGILGDEAIRRRGFPALG